MSLLPRSFPGWADQAQPNAFVAAGLGLIAVASAFPADAAKRAENAAKSLMPMTLVVDLSDQRVFGYRGTERVWSSRISSGKRGHRTPTGVFSIIQKRRRHFSNLYNNAPMPHMQRLTWSGIAFHGGAIPGYAASHGCVRLPYGEAGNLFKMTDMRSTRVVVTYGSPRPTAISHGVLPNRLPATAPRDETPPTPSAERVPRHETTLLMNSVLGVSSALAAVSARRPASASIPSPPARSRAEVRERLERAITDIETALERSKSEIAAARTEVDAQGQRLKSLNVAMRQAARALVSAERKLTAMERQFASLSISMRRLIIANIKVEDLTTEQLERLGEEELRFEERLDEIGAERALLRGETLELREAMAALKPGVAQAQAAYRLTRKKLVATGQTAKRIQAALEIAEHKLERHDLPVHVLISRTKSRIYFRQGYKDIFEADVTFDEADRPVGTHVFKAIDEADDRQTLRWSAITVPDAKYGARRPTRKANSRAARETQRRASHKFDARQALDRIILPEKARQLMQELAKVGSSIVVSDRGPSIETGKGTDFIVLTR